MINSTVLSLKAVAAKAAKLADDLENNKLWPGELSSGISVIQKDLRDAELQASRLNN